MAGTPLLAQKGAPKAVFGGLAERLPGGHAGSVVSSRAKKTLWPRISRIRAEREAA